jgi:hypothetical protein
MDETYLGDGVYASFDGYQIWLDTRAQHPVNRIALEPAVWDRLKDYVTEIGRVPREIESGDDSDVDGGSEHE